jgi:hypothetical protein
MKKIPVGIDKWTLVDDEDYDKVVSAGPWHMQGKAVSHSITVGLRKQKQIKLHRFLMNVTNPKILVDHENRNSLDNQKHNLRVATKSQNASNSKKSTGKSSKYKGVSFHKRRNQWHAEIVHNNKHHFLGYFREEEEAAIAYNAAAKEFFGDFAYVN